MICPHCGGSNFAWSRQCEHCSGKLDATVAVVSEKPVLPELQLALPEPELDAAAQRREELRSALTDRGTQVGVTPALILANVVMFLVLAAQDRSFSTETLWKWGASYGPAVSQGSWWRLVTGTFLHAGFAHAASNMFALAMIGPVAERLFGSTAFLVVYVLSGIGGSLASEWWQPMAVGVGASGAIFGLYGSLLVFLLRRHTTLPPRVVSSLRNGAVVVVLYNIVYGFTQSNIDNAGHVGGLIAGGLAGFGLTTAGEASQLTPARARSLMVACAGVVIAGVVVAALPRHDDLHGNLFAFSKLERNALGVVQRSIEQVSLGKLTEDECAGAIERLLPGWRAQRSVLAALRVPAPDKALLDRLVRYMDFRETAWKLTADGMRKRDTTLLAEGGRANSEALRAAGNLVVPSKRRTVSVTRGSESRASDPSYVPVLSRELGRTQELDERISRLYNTTIAKMRAGGVSSAQVVQVIEKEIIPPWQEQYERLSHLSLHGPPDWIRQPIVEYMRRRLEAWRLLARAGRENSKPLFDQAAAAQREALELLRASQQPKS